MSQQLDERLRELARELPMKERDAMDFLSMAARIGAELERQRCYEAVFALVTPEILEQTEDGEPTAVAFCTAISFAELAILNEEGKP